MGIETNKKEKNSTHDKDLNKINLGQLDNEELWLNYGETQQELRRRNLARTNNMVGERGEFLAVETYNFIAGLSKLQAAPEGTQNVDALSRKGERYSIKTVSEPGTTTGVFYGCGDNNDINQLEKKFEYVIIVQIFKNYKPKRIIELTWEQFLKYRKWHSTMRAWNLSVTKNLLAEAKIILDNINHE
ncbi:MAG: hypothetical protein UU88_C0001G0031 [Parcubacteria group bacterium GW2011_GWC1_42_11]|uniref:Uncharacterized protein n=1 Tax=Candidatus Nomurabacteria bacterium GW2011_GWC2_42_20 TaxID=1618756 RepID=A0A0G0ZHA3_9BACT|nr:MAG: hypothetical protein UU88_C0001G0031 [Parcubacteria group bacterium GW2011_GWC1_42_11]KKS48095.1 MAG: hypothetical protein UV12_C0003G0054 [Candidatus Nomurabacteria bacterium GW2011_GWC2_42_20]KKS58234.1 MAG: hypothetical protein UV24_C0028G0004 [Candidatus Nomurabacteria bacterium GW2011_GWA2_42_41]KKT09635.1 MAG: hypothetical protein UV86_C0004G0054 [Candidatus Nomurabacteria bacterium GW2011_GWB1_43_20]TAN36453.1 MAG: hypothetical protein EPN27_01575 [Patescibacteria group bacterium